MLITFVTYVSRAFRWQVLLNPLKPVRIGPLFTTNLLGFSGIFVLGRAGEVIRPLWLTRQEQIPLTASVATIIVERFVDTLMLVCLFGWALIAVDLPSKASGPLTLMKSAAWIMVGASIAAIIFLFLFRSNIDRIVQYIPVKSLGSSSEDLRGRLVVPSQRLKSRTYSDPLGRALDHDRSAILVHVDRNELSILPLQPQRW